VAVDLSGSNHSNFINCDFSNHTGSYVIGKGSPISLYSCNFSNNNTTSVFRTVSLNMEGCTISNTTPLLTTIQFNNVNVYVQNSTVTGSIGTYYNGFISNSTMG